MVFSTGLQPVVRGRWLLSCCLQGRWSDKAVVPQCSGTHLATPLLSCFYRSEHWLVLPVELREQGGPPGECEIMGQGNVRSWVRQFASFQYCWACLGHCGWAEAP